MKTLKKLFEIRRKIEDKEYDIQEFYNEINTLIGLEKYGSNMMELFEVAKIQLEEIALHASREKQYELGLVLVENLIANAQCEYVELRMSTSDIQESLAGKFQKEFCILKKISFSEIIDCILFCSEDSEKIMECLNNFKNKETIHIQTFDLSKLKRITLYVLIGNEKTYEWNDLIEVDGKYYFHIIDNFGVAIN